MHFRAPNAALSVTVLTWGFNFVAIKVLYQDMSPQTVSLLRFAVMWALLVLVCVVRREPLRYLPGDTWKVLAAGLAAMGVYMVLFLEGMRGTSAAEGAIVLATSPVCTFLLACLVRQERFTWIALTGCVIAFAGVSIVVLGGAAAGHGSVRGNLLVLASALVWSLQAVFTRPILGRYSATQFMTLSMPGALLALLPYGLLPTLRTDFAAVSFVGWAMFAQVAVLSGVLAFACFYKGVHQIGAARATTYQFLVPPTAVFFAWLVLGKVPTIFQALGLVVVLAGVSLASWVRMRDARAVEVTQAENAPKGTL